MAGISVKARSVSFRPWKRSENFKIKDLKVSIGGDLNFSAARVRVQIRLLDLFLGRVSLNSVKVQNSNFTATMPVDKIRWIMEDWFAEKDGPRQLEGSKFGDRFLHALRKKSLRIRNVSIENMSVRYAPFNSDIFFRLFLDTVHMNQFQPGMKNSIQFTSKSAWQFHDSAAVCFPLDGEILFELDNDFTLCHLKTA